MSKKTLFRLVPVLVLLFLFGGACPVFGAGSKTLRGHVPEAIKSLAATGNLASTNELHLAIGVPLRDPAGLEKFIAELYDPASSNYRHYLTPEEFGARFGATEEDYAAVKNFALTNGFKITGTSANHLLLDVSARVPNVEQAFHLHLRKYQHPTEAREFFAPDAEPTVDANLAVADVQGLSDFWRPHPKLKKMEATMVTSKTGSGSSGSFVGNDFRNAYVPGSALTGVGQMVGLLQFDGFYSNDIVTYAKLTGNGRTNIVIQTVLLDGYNGVPTTGANSGNGEVSLDIEMAMAMAPGLSRIIVFEGGPNGLQNDILNAMAASNSVKNLSCSWGWTGGPATTTENIFEQMIAQGQSFFNASGDTDAFTVGSSSVNGVDNSSLANAPSSSPNIIQVGGTSLTMSGTGAAYVSETNWNRGSGVGSSGGVSSYFTIPYWQTNISMTANKGSTVYRNIPDVALAAENIYVYYGNGSSGTFGGTSCAAPLWAGFMALVNQQAANLGLPAAGFINPAIYALGKGLQTNFTYAACFHDITNGNNYWTSSKTQYPAVTNYDLCTGWGTPRGTNLINALAGMPDVMGVSPATGFVASGAVGGPFAGAPQTFTLTNSSAAAVGWSLVNTSAWLTVSNLNGTLAAGKQTNVTVNLSAAANSLPLGTNTSAILFSNQTTHVVQLRQFTLQVLPPLSVSPAYGFTSAGPVGGPFTANAQSFVVTNLSSTAVQWGLINTSTWLSASSQGGTLASGTNTTITLALATSANSLAPGVYTASVQLTNQGMASANLLFTLQIGQNMVQNGGFETGDFTGWSESDSSGYTSVSSGSAHTGSYGVSAGASLVTGYVSQVFATIPNQFYLLSFWLYNAGGGSTEIFQANWNGTNVYSLTNPASAMAWTNITRVVTATSTNTALQFAERNDPAYFYFDDVSVLAIPTPTFTTASKLTNGISFSWNTLAGLSYVVQYKTNLLQTNWISLVTNTSVATTTSYTNTVGADPRRFYRIRRLP